MAKNPTRRPARKPTQPKPSKIADRAQRDTVARGNIISRSFNAAGESMGGTILREETVAERRHRLGRPAPTTKPKKAPKRRK